VASPGSKRSYTDEQKGAAYASYIGNGKNKTRAAREMGIPLPTLRTWIREWEARGGVPETVQVAAEASAKEFVDRAEVLRDSIMDKLQELVPHADLKQFTALMTGVGIISDKINAIKGVHAQKVEVKHTLPDAEEAAGFMSKFLEKTVAMAAQREQDIIDVEVIEEQPKGLPAPMSYVEE